MNENITSGFTLLHTDENGITHEIALSGSEVISTPCHKCGGEYSMSFENFLDIMRESDLYFSSMLCATCSAVSREAAALKAVQRCKNYLQEYQCSAAIVTGNRKLKRRWR